MKSPVHKTQSWRKSRRIN